MKKQWHNMKSINIKMTMGPSVKVLWAYKVDFIILK
jgi:ribosomal protein L1